MGLIIEVGGTMSLQVMPGKSYTIMAQISYFLPSPAAARISITTNETLQIFVYITFYFMNLLFLGT
jgi:hypothetical protein